MEALERENARLKAENATLREKLNLPPKTPDNSSTPPAAGHKSNGETTRRLKGKPHGVRARVYVGEAVHKGTAYPGEHEAIIDRALWNKVHSIPQESPRQCAANTRNQTPALLRGLIFGPNVWR